LILLRRWRCGAETNVFEPNSGVGAGAVQRLYAAADGPVPARRLCRRRRPVCPAWSPTTPSTRRAASTPGASIVELRVAPSVPMRFLSCCRADRRRLTVAGSLAMRVPYPFTAFNFAGRSTRGVEGGLL
jgi:hypothetical protein